MLNDKLIDIQSDAPCNMFCSALQDYSSAPYE